VGSAVGNADENFRVETSFGMSGLVIVAFQSWKVGDKEKTLKKRKPKD
jgi:hypothetical protein